MKNYFHIIFILISALTLFACGGSGDSSSPTNPTNPTGSLTWDQDNWDNSNWN